MSNKVLKSLLIALLVGAALPGFLTSTAKAATISTCQGKNWGEKVEVTDEPSKKTIFMYCYNDQGYPIDQKGAAGEPCGEKAGASCMAGSIGNQCPNNYTWLTWFGGNSGRDCGSDLYCCISDSDYKNPSDATKKPSKDSSSPSPNSSQGSSGAPSSSSSSTATSASYSYPNPIGYKSVSEFISGVLTNLQNIVGWIAVILLVIGGLMYIFSGADSKLASTAKNTVTAALVGFALVVAGPSLLRELKDIMMTGNGTTANLISNANSLQKILANFLDFIIAIVIVGSIIGFILGGITLLSSTANSAQAEKGKSMLKYSALAILTAGTALIVVKQVLSLLMMRG